MVSFNTITLTRTMTGLVKQCISQYPCVLLVSLILHIQGVYLQCPLGYGNAPVGSVSTSDKLNAQEFFDDYIKLNKPIVVKNLLRNSKPLQWTDDYLRRKFGHLTYDIDNKKVDDRSTGREITMNDFLSVYDQKLFDGYLISTLPKPMQEEFPIPTILNCDTVLNRMQDFVLWFSSGNTKSKLHFDNVENVYCQLFGIKKWFMVEPKVGNSRIPIDNPEGQYCNVNVSSVNFEKYPGLKTIEWWNATLSPGDCLYVPYNWWHQVNSLPGKNMAVNIWFAPIFSIKTKQIGCKPSSNNQYLSNLKLNPGEWFRLILLEMLSKQGGMMPTTHVKRFVLHEHTNEQLFSLKRLRLLDIDGNGILEIKELESITAETVYEAVNYSQIGAVFIDESKALSLTKQQISREGL